MPTLQERYDEAMGVYSRGDYDLAIVRLQAVLADDPDYFDARLALGMAYCRRGDYAAAITEGHRAAALRPREQLVHTNLSVFYMKAGDKATAEHHALQARLAAWTGDLQPPADRGPSTPALPLAGPKPQNIKVPGKFPDMPWKKRSP